MAKAVQVIRRKSNPKHVSNCSIPSTAILRHQQDTF